MRGMDGRRGEERERKVVGTKHGVGSIYTQKKREKRGSGRTQERGRGDKERKRE